MEKLKILAIVGSFRKDSYNRQLALLAQTIIGDRAVFELLDYDDVPFFNEDIENPAPESVSRVREEVKKADGIWFFSPEYNHFFSGGLKNLIDWLSRTGPENKSQVLSKKPAAISGISLGMYGTGISQDHLVTLLSLLNMRIMNYPRLTIPYAAQKLNAEGKLELGDSAQFLEKQANAFLNFIANSVYKV